ncbi:MAG: GNAT family N-acetyltransferase [Chloroflexota bacterium]
MSKPLAIRPYQRRDRDDILSLMFYSRYTHTHLDWYKAGQWLDVESNMIRLAFMDGSLVGVLGMSPALNDATWIRLIIVAQGYDPTYVLSDMWEQVRLELADMHLDVTAILAINPWVGRYLPALGFHFEETVITLQRPPQELIPAPDTAITLINGYLEDMPQIVAVDHAAFAPPWQMSQSDVRLAQRQAASCTLAIVDDEIVGYEIATRHHKSGHLARIAVHPQAQGKRIGSHLLHHLLSRFIDRGVLSMTVNTQLSNVRSQQLYKRYGFTRNGFDLSVWEYRF